MKDGVSGTSDDNWTDAQYAAMRAVKSFMVRLVVSPEGKGAIVKDVPFTVLTSAVLTFRQIAISQSAHEQGVLDFLKGDFG